MDIAELRAQFPVTRSRAYLFSGALAPAATPVRAAWDEWTQAWADDPNSVYTGEMMIGAMDALRAVFARLIGAGADTIAITDNTCRAANIAIRILARRAGNVVVDSGTYPSSAYPWYARGDHEVRFVATDGVADAAAALAERIDAGTVAVCVTHVAPSPEAATTCARSPMRRTRTARCSWSTPPSRRASSRSTSAATASTCS